jgi:hypothetical protein
MALWRSCNVARSILVTGKKRMPSLLVAHKFDDLISSSSYDASAASSIIACVSAHPWIVCVPSSARQGCRCWRPRSQAHLRSRRVVPYGILYRILIVVETKL